MDKMKILITGATGYIGKKLVDYLLKTRGEDILVTVLTRQDHIPWDDPRVIKVKGDLTNYPLDYFPGKHFDTVIHCAALMADKDYYPKSEFFKVNVEGTKRFILSLKDCSVKQFIHISTVGVYGATPQEPVAEETRYGKNLSHYEWSKMEAENVALASCKEIKVPLTILRLGLVFGEDMKYGWPHVIRDIEKGKMKIIGDGKNLIQLSYIGDILDGIMQTIGRKVSHNSIFNICGKEICPIRNVFDMIADILEVARPSKVPFGPVYLLSKIPRFLKPGRIRLLTPHRVRFFKENHVYSIEKAQDVLNFYPHYSLRMGLKNTIRSYREASHGKS